MVVDMDRTQAAKDRLRELNEPVAEREARTEFVSEEEFVRTIQCCANCVFYKRHCGRKWSTSSDGGRTETVWDESYCQRNPPSLVVDRLLHLSGIGSTPATLIVEGQTTWPQPKRADWCGEYRPLPGFDDAAIPTKRVDGFRPD